MNLDAMRQRGPSGWRRCLPVLVVLTELGCHIQLDRQRSTLHRPGVQPSPISIDREREHAREHAAPPVVPILLIDAGGKTIAKGDDTPGVLKVIEEHDGRLKDPARNPVSMQSNISIELHGETSLGLPKKSFRFKLQDDAGGSRSEPLLALPPGTEWVLHGCAADRTCLRNALAYALGRQFGRYAPRTRFVELVLDGDYEGLFVLVERVRRDKHRVDLPRPSATEADGDITGGYLFEMDQGEGKPTDAVQRDWVSPVSQMIYSYSDPQAGRITADQKAYLHDHLSQFETIMRSSGWNHPHSGYREWLDVPSWVDFALMQELSLNPDAYSKSIFLQKWPRSMGNKLALGPFWDFDLAFGAADFRDSRNTRAWAHTMNRFGGAPVLFNPPGQVPYVPDFWERLWTDPAFQRDLRCRWQQLRRGPLHTEALNGMLDRWVGELELAQPRDAAVWSNPPAADYPGEVESLKKFLGERVAWMDASLPGRCAAA